MDERETLIPQDTPVIQSTDTPIRLNLITGTAILAQFGVWCLFITVWYSILSNDIILASYHPLANSLGLLLLLNSILLVQPTHTPHQKREGTIAHSILNALGVVSFGVGVVVIYYNKASHGAPHFTSTHGKFGLVTVILMLLQLVVGMVQYYAPNWLGGVDKAKKIYKYHRVAGYITTLMVLITVTLGTQTDWFLGKINILWIWIVFDILIVVGTVPRIKPVKVKLF